MQVKNNIQNVNFQGFAKFKAKHHEANHMAKKINEALPDSFVFWDKKNNQKKTFYILTGKHQDKFLSMLDDIEIYDLKQNIEKYLNKKAKKISVKKLEKQIKKGELKI